MVHGKLLSLLRLHELKKIPHIIKPLEKTNIHTF